MNDSDLETYNHIRSGGTGFIELPRGLFAVWGKEAVQFLDGMVTNDMKTLSDGAQMLAAFPNAQGRLLAAVRILRQGDRFLIETEEATREKVFSNLFRFTFAGDFFVEDLFEGYRFYELTFTPGTQASSPVSPQRGESDLANGNLVFHSYRSNATLVCVTNESADRFRNLVLANGCIEISAAAYETLRIESGTPKYGVDMDENTIVPELGIDGMISYTKGCYIGQEIIARIHFRGHVAKELTGLIFDERRSSKAETRPVASTPQLGGELTTADGKNAGRITSVVFSPKLGSNIALAFVRYDYLAEGTKLDGDNLSATVSKIPFVD